MQTLRMRFKYADSDTRLYAFDCEDSLAGGVKSKIKAINSSLQGGTDGGLASFFVSDNGSNLTVIDGATLESTLSEPITIAPNS